MCVFRNTGLDDASQVRFSQRLGELDTMKRYLANDAKPRHGFYEIFDAGNVDDHGRVISPESPRAQYSKVKKFACFCSSPTRLTWKYQGNQLFHVDSSFNPRRASFSLLRAVSIPPPGNGGNTDFADSLTAWNDLDPDFQRELLQKNYIAQHSIAHSRKLLLRVTLTDETRRTMPTTTLLEYEL